VTGYLDLQNAVRCSEFQQETPLQSCLSVSPLLPESALQLRNSLPSTHASLDNENFISTNLDPASTEFSPFPSDLPSHSRGSGNHPSGIPRSQQPHCYRTRPSGLAPFRPFQTQTIRSKDSLSGTSIRQIAHACHVLELRTPKGLWAANPARRCVTEVESLFSSSSSSYCYQQNKNSSSVALRAKAGRKEAFIIRCLPLSASLKFGTEAREHALVPHKFVEFSVESAGRHPIAATAATERARNSHGKFPFPLSLQTELPEPPLVLDATSQQAQLQPAVLKPRARSGPAR
jgi:hypothetical protein